MGDREACNEVELGALINALPGLFCVIGDCAYTPSEHLVPIFRGVNATAPRNDNFNFFASQLRIRIEMAFGLMVKKWGVLARPLTLKIKNVKRLILAIARLHNFCINERLAGAGVGKVFTPRNVELTPYEQTQRDEAACIQFEEMVRHLHCAPRLHGSKTVCWCCWSRGHDGPSCH
jgi:hypothetical protein